MKGVFFLFFFLNLFIHSIIFGCAGTSLLHGPFSGCGEWGLLPSLVHQLFTAGASLVAEPSSGRGGFRSCSTRAQELWFLDLRAQAQWLCLGLGAPRHVGCGVLSDQGATLCLLHWQPDSVPLNQQGSPECYFLNKVMGDI